MQAEVEREPWQPLACQLLASWNCTFPLGTSPSSGLVLLPVFLFVQQLFLEILYANYARHSVPFKSREYYTAYTVLIIGN